MLVRTIYKMNLRNFNRSMGNNVAQQGTKQSLFKIEQQIKLLTNSSIEGNKSEVIRRIPEYVNYMYEYAKDAHETTARGYEA